MSIAYYDRNAELFVAGSVKADMSTDRARFLAHVPDGGGILDGGCGSGRDALAFKTAGYEVTAFDGSIELVRRASAHTGLAVQHLRFDQVEWRETFNGIWTCASLLHVPRADLPPVMARLVRALRPGGVWWMSFKYGDTEREAGGRVFTDMNERLLGDAIAAAGLRALDMWISFDVRPDRADERWISALARR